MYAYGTDSLVKKKGAYVYGKIVVQGMVVRSTFSARADSVERVFCGSLEAGELSQ
jgi:hypothetical protein